MDRETMEYAIDQPVIWEQGGTTFTGTIVGHSSIPNCFIVWLDRRLEDGSRAILVPASAVRPLSCHWCLDTKKVYSHATKKSPATPFTQEQYETGTMPQTDCPYCTDNDPAAVGI